MTFFLTFCDRYDKFFNTERTIYLEYYLTFCTVPNSLNRSRQIDNNTENVERGRTCRLHNRYHARCN